MITAVDTNILVDILAPEKEFTEASIKALGEARDNGRVIVAPEVLAELSFCFNSPLNMEESIDEMDITMVPHTFPSIHLAGIAWMHYRRRSTNPKDRLLPDFLIGAHASTFADALITRDRGYFHTYFPKLKIITP